MSEEERYWSRRLARKAKLKMRYRGRYWEEIAATREKLELLQQIVQEKVLAR